MDSRTRRGSDGPSTRSPLVRPPHALGAINAGRGRSRQVRSRLLARLLQAHPFRRRLPQRRRMRRLLPDEDSAALPQQVARPDRRLWRPRRRLPQAEHDRDRPHRSSRRPSGRVTTPTPIGSPSTPTARSAAIWAMPELWVTCALGPYNFEFMTEVTQGDHVALQGRRHLQQPLGRLRHVLLRALPATISKPPPASTCRARTIRRTPPAAPTSGGISSDCSNSGTCGTTKSARSIPTPATFPTPAAAPPASST